MYRTKVSDCNLPHDKIWTNDANEALLELMEDRRKELFRPDSEITPNMRMEIWKEIACQMRDRGFTQTTASCNKKYCNMRRTYMSNRKKNAEIRRHNKKLKPRQKIQRILVWPYYERLEKLLAKTESDSDGGQDNAVDEEDDEVTDDEEDSRPGTSVTVANRAIRNLLQTNRDPVLILEDVQRNKDNTISTTEPIYKVEMPDPGEEEVLAEDQDNPTIIHQQESGGVHESPPLSSTALVDPIRMSIQEVSQRALLGKRKPKRRMNSRNSIPPVSSKRPRNSPAAPAVVSGSTEAMVVEEVQGLRQEVRGINRNLEKLVDVQNRLNDTFERFLTAMRLRL